MNTSPLLSTTLDPISVAFRPLRTHLPLRLAEVIGSAIYGDEYTLLRRVLTMTSAHAVIPSWKSWMASSGSGNAGR